MIGLTLTTAPASEPVSRADMKEHLRIASADTTYDSLVDALIVSARRLVEARSHRALIHRTLTATLDYFPGNNEPIYLPWSPLSSVTSVYYIDAEGNSTLWASTEYLAITNKEPGRIVLKYDKTWPTTRYQPQAATIVYVAGHASSAGATVPQEATHCIKMLCSHWFENPAAVITGTTAMALPFAVESLLQSFTVGDEFMSYGYDRYLAEA